MKILITAQNKKAFVIYDTFDKSVTEIPNNGAFDITWDKKHIYVSNKNNVDIYDTHFTYLDSTYNAVFPKSPISYYKQHILGLSNRSTIKFMNSRNLTEYLYLGIPSGHLRHFGQECPTESSERIHSVVGVGESLYIGSDRAVWKWNTNTNSLVKHQDFKDDILGLYVRKSLNATLSPGESPGLILGGRTIDLSGVHGEVKGMCANKNTLVVGYNNETDTTIECLQSNKVVHTGKIKNCTVGKIRLLDEFDFCHHNPYALKIG